MTEPYRDQVLPLTERLREVEQELSYIDRAAARRDELHREAADLRERLRAVQALGPLDDLRIAAPCNAKWEEMVGDNRVRHCASCDKDVFNVSGMTRAEALELVRGRSGELCLRMARRADGTVLTSDCPVGVRRRRVRRLVMVGAGVAASAASALWFWSDPPRYTMGEAETVVRGESDQTMGKMERTPHIVGTAAPLSPAAPAPSGEPKAPTR